MNQLQKATLVMIVENNNIILGMKKKKLGKGFYNGFGGKPNQDESLVDCAIRETKEESGVILYKEKLKEVGIIRVYFENKPQEYNQEVHIFKYPSFNYKKGALVETKEMKPEVFSIENIPYDQMLPGDKYWLPKVLNENYIEGIFSFSENNELVKYEVNIK